MQFFFGVMIFLTSLFLILLVLIQRGRGGGLAGALGGMGGQSAFGTKAGDLFTKITIGVAAVWILLSMGAIAFLNKSHSVFGGSGGGSVFSTGQEPDAGKSTSAEGGKDPALETETTGAAPAGAAPAGAAGTPSTAPPASDSPASDSASPPASSPEKK
jgi:preprotein translocase subunit SecG